MGCALTGGDRAQFLSMISVGGAGENSPTCEMGTFFMSLTLTEPIFNNSKYSEKFFECNTVQYIYFQIFLLHIKIVGKRLS